MRSSIGHAVELTVFGESHGPAIGCVINGLTAGIPVDPAEISAAMERRKPHGRTGTARHEEDIPELVSGVYNGRTTGTPLTMLIRNKNTRSEDYEKTQNLLRPSHADYTGAVHYHGYNDPRGGGHFSGRLTAPLVAAGALCSGILRRKGIFVGTHIAKLGPVQDKPFSTKEPQLGEQIRQMNQTVFPVFDSAAAREMEQYIESAARQGDSVGGILETAVVGIPAGIGEPMFDSVESVLSALLFSVPAVKGVEFGRGFGFADGFGSELNDPFALKDGKIVTTTNNNGGINGGITNGMPIVLRCAVKPTPSIYKQQDTVDFKNKIPAKLSISGRHDPAIIHRAAVVVDSVVSFGLVDLFCMRFGTEWMGDL